MFDRRIITYPAPPPIGVLIGLAIVTIFVADCLMPLSHGVWLLYLLPLLLASLSQRGPNALALAGLCSLLMVFGFALAPPGIDHEIAIVNRLGGILVLWLTALLLAKRHRAEEALRESELQMRLFMEATTDCIWNWDLSTNELVRNIGFSKAFGYSPQEIEPTITWWEERLHPDDREKVLSIYREVVASGGDTCGYEYRFSRKDGTYATISDRCFIVRDANGKPTHALGAMTDISERRQAEDEVRALSGRVLQMQDEERRRLARELHDQTAQELAAVAMNLSTLRRLAPDLSHKALVLLDETAGLTDRAAQEIRTLAYLLHSPLLESIGLVAAVRDYVPGFASRSNIVVAVEADAAFARLPGEAELAPFRIVQEALGNVHRHSGSQTAAVYLTQDAEEICLEVRDSGRGFGTGRLSRLGMLAGEIGIGIAGMRERMRQLGGQLKIDSSPRGTTVRATLPVGKER